MGAEGYGGGEAAGGGAPAFTLAQTYLNGAGVGDSTLTLDATRVGLVVTATGLTGVKPVTINHTLAPTAGAEVSFAISGNFAPASGTATYQPVSINYTVNQTGGANGAVTGVLVNATETAVVGTHRLVDLQVGSVSKLIVTNAGAVAGSASTAGTLTLRGTVHANNDGTVIVTSANTVSTTAVLQVESTAASGYAVLSMRSNGAERGGLQADFGGTTRLYATGAINICGGGIATTPSIKVQSTGETIVQIGLYGGTSSAGNFFLNSTTHATKGLIGFGSSTGLVYDETNKRLGVGITPTADLHVGKSTAVSILFQASSGSCTLNVKSGAAGNDAQTLYEIAGGQDWLQGNKQTDGTFRISNGAPLGTNDVLVADTGRSVQLGAGGLAAGATAGFVYFATIGASPSGVPGSKTGYVPLAYDTTNNKLYVYNGAWKSVTLA